ncbi:hypothetical protein [Actinophytocola glycyrrhizae]|uniref:Uncharacterized protein n=1 Tax=Actinophytocola glycyrrhizae TaxID=2044873 RepID=A0ABV9S2F5_9PSEU
MSMSRAAVFTTRIALLAGTAALAVALPFLGATSASAGEDPPPPPTTTATTEGHDWND